MNPQNLLEHLLKLERRVRDLYRLLGGHTDFSDQLRSFWNTMAEDETHHIVTLERSAHLFDVMERPPSGLEAEVAAVEALLAAAEATVQRPTLTADDALQTGLAIEGSELNHLDEAWLHGFRATSRLLLEALTPSHHTHVRRLVEAVHQFSTDSDLQAKADALWATYEQQRDKRKPTPPTP